MSKLPRTRLRNRDAAVQATNDDAFESKIASMDRGYFQDNYLMQMKQNHLNQSLTHNYAPRRPPIINRGTYARILLKQTLIDAFLKHYHNNSQQVQIISLGAGFDTLAFNLLDSADNYPPFFYIELDLLQVIRQKTLLSQNILSSQTGPFSECKTEGDIFSGKSKKQTSASVQSKYALAPCDLRNIQHLCSLLQTLNVNNNSPTLILAEIVLVYMHPKESDALISELEALFTADKCFVNIEHTSPNDEFGKQMMLNIAARGSPLLGLQSYPTLISQKKRFEKAGWSHVSATTMLQSFQNRLSREQAARLQQIELLDEFEEFHMLMMHYCVIVATAGNENAKQLLTRLIETLHSNSRTKSPEG